MQPSTSVDPASRGTPQRPLRILFAAADTRPDRWLAEIPQALAVHGLKAEALLYHPPATPAPGLYPGLPSAPPGFPMMTPEPPAPHRPQGMAASTLAPVGSEQAGAGDAAACIETPSRQPAPVQPLEPDYALVWKPPAVLFEQHPGLRAVFNLGAGVDGLLSVARVPAHVPVIRLDDAGMAIQMADYACATVLRWYRRLDRYAQQQQDHRWTMLKVPPKSSFSIGVMGYGVLGKAVCRQLQALGFPVRAWRRTPVTHQDPQELPCCSGEAGLREMLGLSRVVICLLPLTPETRGLINRERLSWFAPDAWLINLARGAHVVERDLLDALDSGHLSGAQLDVFDREPLPEDHPYWRHPRIQITPHIAALTQREESLAQIARKIAQLERGEAVSGVVDRVLGY